MDPSNSLSKADQLRFHELHKKYESVFSSGVGCYNGYSGKFTHVINMSPDLPPQRRGRIPIYNRGDMGLLQEKFDELLQEGVLARAEDIGVPVEYVHPSFLIKKQSGGHRLVTSFGEVAEYARPQPTITSNPEHVLQQVGQWKYIIKADLTKSYYQILLDKLSCKYVGVLTPYSGTLVYLRSVMGLPGSEAALEELLSRIFGDLIQEGKMIKLADDMYVGSDNIDDLSVTWGEILKRLYLNGLKLSASKTVCCPTSTSILGWQWEKGTIRPSSHQINALLACEPPTTVKGLRSYIGCCKFRSRVLKHYAELLHPLEEACGGKQSGDKVHWSDELEAAFKKTKDHLKKIKPIILPRSTDQLHIVTDAAINCSGIAATLYVTRDGKPVIAGYFSAVLRKHQERLMPCDLEALAIGVSLKHFAYYVLQSKKQTRILTDSRPCVLAYKKLLRGEYSASPKVTTFLAIASRYKVEIMHIKGSENVFSDYASRNPAECNSSNCQICEYIQEVSTSSVGEVKISDIISGESKVPFTTKNSWIGVQQACTDLNQVYKYLTTGASIPKNKKQLTDVRRYLSCGVSLSSGQRPRLLVIRQSSPFKPTTDRIVIPRHIAAGLITAMHIQLDHPSAHQLKLIFSRAFYCLDLSATTEKVVEGCYACAALKKVPANYHKQTTSPPIDIIGGKFASDVIRREGQFVLLLREDITSFTDAVLINDEKAQTLRDGILLLASRLRSPVAPSAVIRTDPASGLRSLVNDKLLFKSNLTIELGEAKNKNKNPIAEKAVQELHAEIVRLQPLGGKITATLLAQAISNLNSRIRGNSLSACEAWTQRDMTTGNQLTVDDKELINLKQLKRCADHEPSAKYKARGKVESTPSNIQIGDLVYIYSDRSKLRSRDKYICTGFEDNLIKVQKFTGCQFRGREYKVKESDLITVAKHNSDNTDSKVSEETPTTISEEELMETKLMKPKITRSQIITRKPVPPPTYLEESSSEESSDDEDFFIPPRQNLVLREPHQEGIDVTPVPGRPIRDRRQTDFLGIYVQDVSQLFDDDDYPVELTEVDEGSAEELSEVEEGSTEELSEVEESSAEELPEVEDDPVEEHSGSENLVDPGDEEDDLRRSARLKEQC